MPKNQNKTDEDERAAAVIVVTVIKPGETTLAASPSAIIKVREDQLTGLQKLMVNPEAFDLLQWVKATVTVEIDYANRVAFKGHTPRSTLPSNEHDPVARELLGLEPEHSADENTPADHFFNS